VSKLLIECDPRRFAWLAGTLALLVSGPISAESAHRAHLLAVGTLVSASGEGLDSGNTSTTHFAIPRQPNVAFRTRLSGGIGQPLASDAAGNLFVAHGEPRLSKLSPDGRQLWSRRLEAEAVAPPMITTGGEVAVITLGGDISLFSAIGAELGTTPLPFSDPRRHTLGLPLSTGGLAVASGNELFELSSDGQVLRQGHAKSPVISLAESGPSLLAVSDNGAIAEARASGDFEPIGSFGGPVTEGAAARDGRLYAVVDSHELAAFELKTGTTKIVANDFAVAWSGPPVVLGSGGFALVVDGGFVSVRAPNGSETLRVALLEGRTFDPLLRALRPARVIGDDTSALVAVRSSSDALVLVPDGHAVRLEDTACLDPFRPTPTRRGLALACRSGQLFIVSDKAP